MIQKVFPFERSKEILYRRKFWNFFSSYLGANLLLPKPVLANFRLTRERFPTPVWIFAYKDICIFNTIQLGRKNTSTWLFHYKRAFKRVCLKNTSIVYNATFAKYWQMLYRCPCDFYYVQLTHYYRKVPNSLSNSIVSQLFPGVIPRAPVGS